MSAYAIETTPVSAATVTSSSVAFSSSPVNDRRLAQTTGFAGGALAAPRPYAGAAADIAPEVLRLGQWALRAR
jgi:hypothetical protein